jgi:hypothetical protein
MQGIECGKAARDSIASKIISDLESLSVRTGNVLSIVQERTKSVTRDEQSETQGANCVQPPQEQYPPLFGRIRELTNSINNSLSGIEDTMRRCEL